MVAPPLIRELLLGLSSIETENEERGVYFFEWCASSCVEQAAN